MAQFVQRKRFDDAESALETAYWFNHPHFKNPALDVVTNVHQDDGGAWLTLTTASTMFEIGDEMLLPGWEKVSVS